MRPPPLLFPTPFREPFADFVDAFFVAPRPVVDFPAVDLAVVDFAVVDFADAFAVVLEALLAVFCLSPFLRG